MSNTLGCGHPMDCQTFDDAECAWCEEVAGLKRQIETLRDAMKSDVGAITVHGYARLSRVTVGLLEVTGGTVVVEAERA